MQPSNRPRSLRDLNPDLLSGGAPTWRQRLRTWRRRRAPGSMRTAVAYLNAVLRRLGEQRRACCADLQAKLDDATRAVDIQTARAQAAEKRAGDVTQRADEYRVMLESANEAWEREAKAAIEARNTLSEAQKAAAKWEIEAADCRDALTQEKQRADAQGREVHKLRNDMQAAASLRLERLERERAVFVEAITAARRIVSEVCLPIAARPAVWSERRKKGETAAAVYDIGLATDRAAALIEKGDPDPRTGRPGAGADLLASGDSDSPARKAAIGLLHTYWLHPHYPLRYRSNAGAVLEALRVLAPDLAQRWADGESEETILIGEGALERDDPPAVPPPPPAAPEVNRAPNMRRHRWGIGKPARCSDCGAESDRAASGQPCPGKPFEPQIFAGHSGDMVPLDDETEHVCAKCGRAISGPMRSDGINGHVHLDRCPDA